MNELPRDRLVPRLGWLQRVDGSVDWRFVRVLLRAFLWPRLGPRHNRHNRP